MANAKYKGKIIENFHSVKIGKLKTGEIVLVTNNNQVLYLEGCDYVEVKGNVEHVDCINIGYVIGDVKRAEIGNCGYVEGYIKNFPKGNVVHVDRNFRVVIGKELEYQNAFKGFSSYQQVKNSRLSICHIEGDLKVLGYSINGYPAIIGNVGVFKVGNCGHIKGTVEYIQCGNQYYCTCGEVPKINYEKEAAKKHNEAKNFANNLFNGFF